MSPHPQSSCTSLVTYGRNLRLYFFAFWRLLITLYRAALFWFLRVRCVRWPVRGRVYRRKDTKSKEGNIKTRRDPARRCAGSVWRLWTTLTQWELSRSDLLLFTNLYLYGFIF